MDIGKIMVGRRGFLGGGLGAAVFGRGASAEIAKNVFEKVPEDQVPVDLPLNVGRPKRVFFDNLLDWINYDDNLLRMWKQALDYNDYQDAWIDELKSVSPNYRARMKAERSFAEEVAGQKRQYKDLTGEGGRASRWR